MGCDAATDHSRSSIGPRAAAARRGKHPGETSKQNANNDIGPAGRCLVRSYPAADQCNPLTTTVKFECVSCHCLIHMPALQGCHYSVVQFMMLSSLQFGRKQPSNWLMAWRHMPTVFTFRPCALWTHAMLQSWISVSMALSAASLIRTASSSRCALPACWTFQSTATQLHLHPGRKCGQSCMLAWQELPAAVVMPSGQLLDDAMPCPHLNTACSYASFCRPMYQLSKLPSQA